MVFGKELVKTLKECRYIKGNRNTRGHCYDCPMAIGKDETPCKDLITWWSKETDLNLKKIRERKKCTF